MSNVAGVKTKQLRSVQQLFQMIKAEDPDTAVTEYLVRKIVYEGAVPSVKTGNKRLAAFEDLLAYLFDGKRWPIERSDAR